MILSIELPAREEQIGFNRQRWSELLSDDSLAILPYRIETNAHGQLLMTPPPSGGHSYRQTTILLTLARMLDGQPLSECPISTMDGVKAADVGWYSKPRFEVVRDQAAFEIAPEICVEVISPRNTVFEMRQKRQLYFEAGANEVWFCHIDGRMEFYNTESPDQPQSASLLCPLFPHNL